MLAIDRSASPLFFFTGYWKSATPGFQDKWYLTGDVMKQDEEGYHYFVGRNDDLITTAGYRVGPADVENALIEHMSVAEAAVVGKPDPERTEIIKAFVVLRGNTGEPKRWRRNCGNWVRRRLSAHAYPREISFETELPKNPREVRFCAYVLSPAGVTALNGCPAPARQAYWISPVHHRPTVVDRC